MSAKFCIYLISVLYLLSNISFAVERIIVIADKIETLSSKNASTVTIFTAAEIQRSNIKTVYDLLRNVAGISVANSAGGGGATSVFIRGAESGHTLVIVDGIEMNDPSTPNHFFDFAHLDLTNVERVEILKGPQSVLYGSDAIGGVISITTKKGSSVTPRGHIQSSFGSYKTVNTDAGIQGKQKNFNYSLSFLNSVSQGYSSASEKENPNAEKDGQKLNSFKLQVGTQIPGGIGVKLIAHIKSDEVQIDDNGGANSDDPNRTLTSKKEFLKLEVDAVFLDGLLESIISISNSKQRRKDNDYKDSRDTTDNILFYTGEQKKLSIQNNIYITETLITTIGTEGEFEKDSSKETVLSKNRADTYSFYIHQRAEVKDFFLSTGVRYDRHSIFKGHTSVKIAPGYNIKPSGTKIKSTFATGYKAPSLYQLFSPTYGNRGLQPERSEGYELGLEQTISSFGNIEIVYFYTYLHERIGFDPAYVSINTGRANFRGFEFSSNFQIADKLKAQLQWTKTKTKDLDTNLSFIRRPKYAYTASLNYRYNDKTEIIPNLQYIGRRGDLDANTLKRVEKESYTLFNVDLNYMIKKNLKTWIKLGNVFDKDYEEIDGYTTAGRNFTIGLRLQI